MTRAELARARARWTADLIQVDWRLPLPHFLSLGQSYTSCPALAQVELGWGILTSPHPRCCQRTSGWPGWPAQHGAGAVFISCCGGEAGGAGPSSEEV